MIPLLDLDELQELVASATTREEAQLYRLVAYQQALEEQGYEAWLRELYPQHFSNEFAPHQHDMWDWIWGVEHGVRPNPDAYAAIWFRSGGKSTNLEAGTVALGARRRRRYGLYVCATHDRADDHVTSIGGLLEDDRLAKLYPRFSQRRLSKYGPQRGWRRNRLWTATGFTIDALGLDMAVRGVKLEEIRPDFIVLDDIDGALDSEGTVRKNVTIITRNLLPSMSNDGIVLAGQNLVHSSGVFARIAGMVPEEAGFASFLARAKVSGPIPAATGLIIERQPDPEKPGRTRAVIVAGRPTWEGKSIENLQAELDASGESAFRAEFQHEVDRLEGAMFERVLGLVRHHEVEGGIDGLRQLVSRMVRTTVWCDPAVTEKDSSDSYGIQADGIDADGTIWRLHSWEERSSPRATLKQAIAWAYELGSPHVGVETDQGGDTWYDTFAQALQELKDENPEYGACQACGRTQGGHDWDACKTFQPRPSPTMLQDKAGAGHGPKQERGSRMLADYERPGPPIVHVYGYPNDSSALDQALGRVFVRKPFDLADAAYWSWVWLRTTGDPGTGADASAAVGPIRRR